MMGHRVVLIDLPKDCGLVFHKPITPRPQAHTPNHPLALTNPIDNPFGLSNYFLLPAFFKVSGAISQRASGSWRKD